MNIPSKVKIAYNDYDVIIVDGHIVDDNKSCYGNIEYGKSKINLSNLYSQDIQKCTLIHECLHGIDDIVEADLTEVQVNLMAKGLYTFIKDNPSIFENNK